jgi:hypothetical protein
VVHDYETAPSESSGWDLPNGYLDGNLGDVFNK